MNATHYHAIAFSSCCCLALGLNFASFLCFFCGCVHFCFVSSTAGGCCAWECFAGHRPHDLFFVKSAWSPQVHGFFGPEHNLGVQEVLLCGRHAAPQNVPHQQVLDCVLRMLPRGWFEYDGLTPAGSRRRLRDATREIKRLRKCLALAEHPSPSGGGGGAAAAAAASSSSSEKRTPAWPKRPEDMDRQDAAHGSAGLETLKKRARLSRHAD